MGVLLIAFGGAIGCVGVCAVLMWCHNKRSANDAAARAPQPFQGTDPNSAGAANAEAVAALRNTDYFEVKRVASTMYQVRPLPPTDATTPEPMLPQTIGSDTPEACEICCEAQAEVVFLPCGHGGLCQGCADAILTRSGQHCAHCRGAVRAVLIIESPMRLLHGQNARARLRKAPPETSAVAV